MCSIGGCPVSNDTYRALNDVPKILGDVIACEQVLAKDCIIPIIHTLSDSLSQIPLPKTWAIGSSSSSPSPSSTPKESVIPLPEGSMCNMSSVCEEGTNCNCLGYCTKVYTIRVDAIGDNHIMPFICGNALGPESPEWDIGVIYVYTGPCSDIYYHVLNTDGATGMVASVSTDNITFTHTSEGEGLVIHAPPNEEFLTDPSYDFSSWEVPVVSAFLRCKFEWIVWMMGFSEHQGSAVWSNRMEVRGSNWYRQKLPFCKMSRV